MRQPEVCKHQVSDHCGGRFGMVTHRWWGNKFCKRACKNAHRRENYHTQSGWVIPRFFTFAGGACLAAGVAVATLTLLLASANAAPGEERPVAGSSLKFNKEDGTLYIDSSGPIVAGMVDDLRAALGKYGTTLNRVVLLLASAGGQVEEGDRVIKALNEIKLRHQLITVVAHGKLCASMCIPIFLQGEDCLARYGGGVSSFHRRLVYRSKTSIGKIDRWAACSARRGSQRHHQQHEVSPCVSSL
jgi:hypothetical protein